TVGATKATSAMIPSATNGAMKRGVTASGTRPPRAIRRRTGSIMSHLLSFDSRMTDCQGNASRRKTISTGEMTFGGAHNARHGPVHGRDRGQWSHTDTTSDLEGPSFPNPMFTVP